MLSAAILAGSSMSAAGQIASAVEADTSGLTLDREGADIFPENDVRRDRVLDITTLYLDRDGADIPAGNWWGISGDPGSVARAALSSRQGPGVTRLNLDRDGADVFAN
jgi:hypothetical protein